MPLNCLIMGQANYYNQHPIKQREISKRGQIYTCVKWVKIMAFRIFIQYLFYQRLRMEERENVEVVFLGNISHESELQAQGSEKCSYQDQISFADPVQIELIRIPNNGKTLYSRITSQTQKQPIKSLEIYYRNLDKKLARYSLLVCSSSELLVSSSIDILVTLRETIYTDLLVIRGNFTNITFCIYGRVLQSKQEIDKKCPYFLRSIDVALKEDQPSIKINRNVFNESRAMVKAIEEEYSEAVQQRKVESWDGCSNDREIYDSQINNICKLSQQLLAFEDLNHIQQRSIVQIRAKLETMQSHLSKLFKSAHIGLYYPTPYRPSAIPQSIPVTIVKIATKLLSESLSDQYRALEVLKLVLQLKPHAQYFVKLDGIHALIRLFLAFFTSDLVILSSLKSLLVQVFIALSFWKFSAQKMVEKISLFEPEPQASSPAGKDQQSVNANESPSKSKSKSKSRSREKKKKRSQATPSKSEERGKKKSKKEKKEKKNKDRSKQKSRDREKDKKKDKNKEKEGKDKKQAEKTDNIKAEDKKDVGKVSIDSDENIRGLLNECNSFYQVLFQIVRVEKNSKLQQILRILIQQITQTLTKNLEVSNEMAYYTPLLRDTKYMFNQGGEMINSKSLKSFAFFQPFLNYQQSVGVESAFICEGEKIKQPSKYGISAKLFKLIDSALTIFQSKAEDEAPTMFDETFMTLVSALIENNKSGVSIGLSSFIDAIRVDTLLGLKKQEAVIAILCEYIHEVFIEDEGMNLIFYLDQIHNSMLKIINWLKEDKTFSLEIKRKVQYLINSALIYNHFSGTENNFKSFSEYFIKLIGHQNLDINKILQYSRKQYSKTVNPLSYTNISENFSLGNFYDVLPAQPLLQVDICLRMFLAMLRLNKNIWTVFYEFKFVPAFSTLFLKIHSLLKFFLSASLERENAIIDIKMHDRLIGNYLQVAKHITAIFICKWRYESSFNELTEEEDIFDTVELYEKWIDSYLFLFNSLASPESLVCSGKTSNKIKELLRNIIQLFDVVFKGYELTKNVDRQRNIKSIVKFIYREHYDSVVNRAAILSLLTILINLAGAATYDVIVGELLGKNPKNPKDNYDILLPENERSAFENMLRRNMYREDANIRKNLSVFISELLKKESSKEKVCEILELILDENEAHSNEDMEEMRESRIMEKNILFANLLSDLSVPTNPKIQQHMLRLLKISMQRSTSAPLGSDYQAKLLMLRNSYLKFFKRRMEATPQLHTQLFLQYLKTVSGILNLEADIEKQGVPLRLQRLNSVLLILEALVAATSHLALQSLLLYGEYTDKPVKPACEISLENIISFCRQSSLGMKDQREGIIVSSIVLAIYYLLCKLTSIDGSEFYSTQSRKNALSCLISPQRNFSVQDLFSTIEDVADKTMVETLKNYLDFPIVEKLQSVAVGEKPVEERKTIGSTYSRGVFTIISQNDPVGKTRYELIQEKWQGGSIEGDVFKVNFPIDYHNLFQEMVMANIARPEAQGILFNLEYVGIHRDKEVNNLFSFKIRKIFTQEAKKNAVSANSSIVMKAVPSELKKPEVIAKQVPSSYQAKLNTSPSLNRNMNPPLSSPQNSNNSIPKPTFQPSVPNPVPPNPSRASSSNNREPSPYATKPMAPVSGGHAYHHNPIGYVPNPPLNPNVPTPTPPFYPAANKPMGYTNPTMPKSFSNPVYDHPAYDPRGYYTPQPYDSRGGFVQPPVPLPPNSNNMNYIRPPPSNMGFSYNNPMYVVPPRTMAEMMQAEEEMVKQAISILLYLQKNNNAPESIELKARVNKYLENQNVHLKVKKYFDDLKKN